MNKNNQTPAWFRYPKYNWDKKHAVVIGAGIAGCQTAWNLVQEGWQVTLIERERKIAQQASGNPAGIISPKMTAQPSIGEDFYVACFNNAIKQLTGLKKKHKKLDWHPCGLLQLAHNQREEFRWQSIKERDFDTEFLQCVNQKQGSDIAGIPIDYKASYFPKAGWINPVSFCETLIADCAENCNVILETDVITLLKSLNNWQLINPNNQIITSAKAIVITSGKDLNQFKQTNQLPSLPVAGQTTFASVNNFAKQLKTSIGHEGYLTPISASTSQLTFGASFERNVINGDLESKTDKNNLEQLKKYLPQLADSFTQINSAHIAIRMTTPDRFPYVGGIADSDFFRKNYNDLHQGKQFKEYPDAQYIDGLFVLGGLGSRGLTTSALCAKLISEIIENNCSEETQFIRESCHPARFIIKDLKRNIQT